MNEKWEQMKCEEDLRIVVVYNVMLSGWDYIDGGGMKCWDIYIAVGQQATVVGHIADRE